MLDCNGREQEIAAWIRAQPCHVNLSVPIREKLEKTGATPTSFEDLRSTRRIYCCGEMHRAALATRQTLPAFPRETAWCGVYTIDLSKNGCGFIHSQPLYPGEKFTLIFLTGLQREIEIAWCRRLDNNCFAIGSRLATTVPASATEG